MGKFGAKVLNRGWRFSSHENSGGKQMRKCCSKCPMFNECEYKNGCCPECDFYSDGECLFGEEEPFEDLIGEDKG
jgi:hypothetical protein